MKNILLLSFAVLCLCALSAYLFFNSYVNLDAANALYEAKVILSGGKYFYDFFETTPPMFLYVFFPVVLVLKWFPIIQFQYVIFFYFLFLSIFSAFLCGLLLKNQLLNLVVLFSFIIVGFGYFGQREEITIVLSIPYFFLLANRLEGKQFNFYLPLLIGLMAGIGFRSEERRVGK